MNRELCRDPRPASQSPQARHASRVEIPVRGIDDRRRVAALVHVVSIAVSELVMADFVGILKQEVMHESWRHRSSQR